LNVAVLGFSHCALAVGLRILQINVLKNKNKIIQLLILHMPNYTISISRSSELRSKLGIDLSAIPEEKAIEFVIKSRKAGEKRVIQILEDE
jgi:hypothetical protein